MNSESPTLLSAIVVDDEPHARQGLSSALEKIDGVEVIALCENGIEAIKAVNELQPDLMFLDIHMPKLDGFDVLELLGEQTPFVIFVTAYDEYAVQAFEANAVDYLMKPLDQTRLTKAVTKVAERMKTEQPKVIITRPESISENEMLRRVLVREGSEVHVLAVDSVRYFEAADDYVAIHTNDATHIKLDRLSKLEEKLDPRQFCRIHRSIILNVNFLVRIETETKDSKIAILADSTELPISRSGYSLLKKFL